MEKLVAYEPDGREEGWLTPASNGEWYRRSDVDQRIAKLEAEKSLFDARLREMRRALDDTDEMRVQAEAKLGRLEKEAWSTVNEFRGSLGAYENELRTIMGNTNFHCLEFRRDNLAHILSDQPKVLAVHDGTHHIDPCGQLWNVEAKDHHTRPIETVTVILEKKGGE